MVSLACCSGCVQVGSHSTGAVLVIEGEEMRVGFPERLVPQVLLNINFNFRNPWAHDQLE